MKKVFFICTLVFLFTHLVYAEENVVKSKNAKDETSEKSVLGNIGLDDILESLTSPMEHVVSPVMELGRIVITPTKTKEKLGAQSSAVTVLGEKSFKSRKVTTVKEALKNEMGLDVVEYGAFTGQTSVFMRGANSNHTLVMIDGIQVYDPISPNAAFNLAHLTLDNVEQIEIVRGPQSTLYGSDAIGGVVNVVTKKTEEPFFNTSFETGAFSTFRESFNMGSAAHGFHYSIGGSNVKSRGISQAQAKNNNPEMDGYERQGFSARVDYDINDDFTVGGTVRYTHALFDYDQFGSDDPNIHQDNHQTILSQYIDHKLLDFYSYYIKLGWTFTERYDNDANNGNQIDFLRDWYKGYTFTFDFRNNIHLFDLDTFTIGYEYTEEMGDSYYFLDWGSGNSESDMPKVFARNSSLYLQNRFNMSDRLTSTQGLRIDYHSSAGTHLTYKLDASYLFPTGTKLRGGWATGFKAPTLYQMHAPILPSFFGWGGFDGGNSNLKPETSQSYEFGVDQYAFGEKLLFNMTYFHMMLKDLIDAKTNPTNWHTNAYMNIDKAHSHGLEIGARIKPLDIVEVGGSYTYNYTKDYSTDTYLLLRPLHEFKINTLWEILPNWTTNLELRYTGLRLATFNTSTGVVDKLKPYAVVDFNTNYKLSDHINLYLKIINMFNKRYEEVRSYGTSPFAVYLGTKIEF